ncbi:hypothetical protein [Nioella sediminis]|jgi:hypothetical protein|uniref:hypothetical protein n=1 Tax=Nioella sediminis TaxID=1912092 RepID=UPI0008FD53CA|nr:hypothetical protein [Nioella sediminis]TBX28050.1 hypothetical protein TK43_07695 [Roseovarius sp. JS7-11]
MMQRRALLAGLASLPILRTVPAFADTASPIIQVAAAPRGRASISPAQGEGFLLEVSGFNAGMAPTAQYSIRMPPASQLGNFEIQRLRGQRITVQIGSNLGNFEIQDLQSSRWSWGDSISGSLMIERTSRHPASGFLILVASASAVFGAEGLGRGGQGQVTVGPTTTGFLLEVSG